jgi:hypothetical protein
MPSALNFSQASNFRFIRYQSYDHGQPVISGFENQQEINAGFFHILNIDYAVKGHLFVGLNNGGPDGGGSLGIVRWF